MFLLLHTPCFCSMNFFLQQILPIVYNNNMTIISATNINQSTFGIVLDGSIWTPARFRLILLMMHLLKPEECNTNTNKLRKKLLS